MPRFMIEGGMNMWFLLVLGLVTLVGAVLFARRPTELRLGPLRAMSIALGLMAVTGCLAGIGKSFAGVFQMKDRPDIWPLMALKGISESLTNVVFGFAMLAIIWLVIAVGLRRLAAKEAALTPPS